MLMLSGCLSLLGDDAGPSAALPRAGDEASYRSEEGDVLDVHVEGPARHVDAHGQAHDVIVVRYALRPIDYPETVLIWESVDASTGLIVLHWSQCVAGQTECWDEDVPRQTISYAAAGLPGALGAAPYWFDHARDGFDLRPITGQVHAVRPPSAGTVARRSRTTVSPWVRACAAPRSSLPGRP